MVSRHRLEAPVERRSRDDRTLEVHEAFTQERPRLLALPGSPFPCIERTLTKVGKQPYVWFDANEYSVPHELAGKQVEIVAVENEVVVHGPENTFPVVTHPRSYGRHEVIEKPEHVEALRRAKPGGERSSGLHRLVSVVPEAGTFVEQLGLRGENIGGAIGSLLRCLQTHGQERVRQAVIEVVASGSCTLRAVQFTLRRLEEAAGIAPDSEPATTPERFAHLTVTHHDTNTYDSITGIEK